MELNLVQAGKYECAGLAEALKDQLTRDRACSMKWFQDDMETESLGSNRVGRTPGDRTG